MGNQEIDFDKYYSIRTAAKFAGVSPSAVRNWILTDRIASGKNKHGKFSISEDDLLRVMREREEELAVAKTSQ